MSKIKLEFTVEEINAILTALGQQPYVQVHQIIDRIQRDAYPQLQEMQKEE